MFVPKGDTMWSVTCKRARCVMSADDIIVDKSTESIDLVFGEGVTATLWLHDYSIAERLVIR